LRLTEVAARLGAGPGLELLARTRASVRCLARGEELLGVTFLDDVVRPPEELRGVWWPGLDAVGRDWVGDLEPPPDEPAAAPDEWTQVTPSVRVVIDRWLERVLQGGSVVLQGDSI